jgi:hypothetical protein
MSETTQWDASKPQPRLRTFRTRDLASVGKDKIERIEDHGPYYAYVPGEPIHRIDQWDGVPHVYPNRVQLIESSFNLKPAELSISRWAFTVQGSDNKPLYANPRYAGEIINSITGQNGGYAHIGAISIKAFERMEPEQIDLDRFNQLIMPEPVWMSEDEVPIELRGAWRRRTPDLIKQAREQGGLNVRQGFIEAALTQLNQADADLPQLYYAALTEIRASIDRFRAFANAYLDNEDRAVQDRVASGKGTYDERDRRLQWLLCRPGIDTLQVEAMSRVPQVTVNVPQQQAIGTLADIARQACPECGEMIALTAKVCIHCKTRFDQPSISLVEDETPEQKEARPRKNGIQRVVDEIK